VKLSVCITINDRSIDDLIKVFGSMEDQTHDEFVIVLDRAEPILANWCKNFWRKDRRVSFVEIVGEPGWKSPVKAWNRGFDKVTGDAIYCFSSETVQGTGNIERAKSLLSSQDAVINGKAECSCGPDGQEVNWGGTAPGNLLCSAAHPRPIGFIWAAPIKAVRSIHGYDEKFSEGYWHDDDDFFVRLWNTGLDFIFDDSIHGIHLHHPRPVLSTEEGKAGILRNREYMLKKYGSLDPWASLPLLSETREGWRVWKHF